MGGKRGVRVKSDKISHQLFLLCPLLNKKLAIYGVICNASIGGGGRMIKFLKYWRWEGKKKGYDIICLEFIECRVDHTGKCMTDTAQHVHKSSTAILIKWRSRLDEYKYKKKEKKNENVTDKHWRTVVQVYVFFSLVRCVFLLLES